jgi:hypothetical protein
MLSQQGPIRCLMTETMERTECVCPCHQGVALIHPVPCCNEAVARFSLGRAIAPWLKSRSKLEQSLLLVTMLIPLLLYWWRELRDLAVFLRF